MNTKSKLMTSNINSLTLFLIKTKCFLVHFLLRGALEKLIKGRKRTKIAEGSHPKQRESEINNIGNTEHSSNLIQLH